MYRYLRTKESLQYHVANKNQIQFIIIRFLAHLSAFNVPSGTNCCNSNRSFITTHIFKPLMVF